MTKAERVLQNPPLETTPKNEEIVDLALGLQRLAYNTLRKNPRFKDALTIEYLLADDTSRTRVLFESDKFSYSIFRATSGDEETLDISKTRTGSNNNERMRIKFIRKPYSKVVEKAIISYWSFGWNKQIKPFFNHPTDNSPEAFEKAEKFLKELFSKPKNNICQPVKHD